MTARNPVSNAEIFARSSYGLANSFTYIVTWLIALGIVAWCALVGHEGIAAEDGPLETAQAIFLIITTVFTIAVAFVKREDPHLQHLVYAVGSLLAFSFLLREVDVEYLNIPPLFKTLGSGKGRNLMLLSLWVGTLAYMLNKHRHHLYLTLRFFRSSVCKFFITGGVFLLLGMVFDKKMVVMDYSQLLEEGAETIGFMFILAGVIVQCFTSVFAASSESKYR